MRTIVLVLATFVCACGSPGLPTSPGQPVPALTTAAGATGTLTWTEIRSSRPLCSEITRQVGSTYPLWLKYEEKGSTVVLSFSQDGPVETLDPMADAPEVFTGSIDGNAINATFTGYPGGLACPGDTTETRQTGGTVKATFSGSLMDGEITDIYGTGEGQVMFVFRFRVTVAER